MKNIYLGVLFIIALFGWSCQTNTPPIADFSFEPKYGNPDSVYRFNADQSFDQEDSLTGLRFRWDWQNDGIWDTDFLSNPTVNHQFLVGGLHTVTLEVEDKDGSARSISKDIEIADAEFGTFVDPRDKQSYRQVAIGEQVWMADNLSYKMEQGCWSNSSYIGYQFEHGQINTPIGFLYDWSAAMKACPPGWHLPSDAEWGELEKSVSAEKEAFNTKYLYWNTSDIGRKLKYHKLWHEGGNGTNEYGFSVLPVGYRNYNGSQARARMLAYFWTSSEQDGQAYDRGFHYGTDGISRALEDKRVGFSVRCLRD
jgi:uncharacterized protein (TIGR02145 family)